MIGAAIVLVLAGLTVPITMVLGAVVFDAAFLAWMAFGFWRDEWQPRIMGGLRHAAGETWHRIPHPHFR